MDGHFVGWAPFIDIVVRLIVHIATVFVFFLPAVAGAARPMQLRNGAAYRLIGAYPETTTITEQVPLP